MAAVLGPTSLCAIVVFVMRAALPLRLARSAAFSVVCVLLAVGAHWFAGGAAPTPQALLIGGAGVMTVAAATAGRERSPLVVIGLLLAAQVFLHELLGSLALSTETTAVAHTHRLGVGTGMLTAHLTAALITGWWLSRGEAALWSILHRIGTGAIHWLRALLTLFQFLARIRPRPRLASYNLDREPRREAVLRHAVVRRGPPVLVFL
ncbi:MFS transporter [Microbispora sp. SCL1-1]|uniref:MFS transporter n=2 Tax=Streptosporangiaceae TaxID=2004 RepID=A0ABZ1ST39_9ACTN|nr:MULTISPECIES: MFS transporter [Microbispora]NJP29554.1 MFS transporter [Microbispora sp. CL1-1]TQS05020.1 MFS transporter [Microbispora sp. SCL1-1]